MTNCQLLPFSDLGFVPYEENLWIKFTEGGIKVPHFAISTTINPVSQTFIVKDLLHNKTISTNTYDMIREFVLSSEREYKLNKLIN